MRHSQDFIRCLFALTFTAILIFNIGSSHVLGQGSIGVDNDGPSFLDIAIEETDVYKYVDVEVRDLNGWNDIFSINITIMGNSDNILSQVCYMQYPNLTSTSVAAIIWNETVGNYLVAGESGWTPMPVAPWNPDNAEREIGLRVIFAFNKFSGDTVNILVMDKGQLTCEYNGPFSAEYTPAPEWENVAIPISLSTMIAVAVAGFMVYRRFKNNKLARAVESSQAASGER